MSEFTNNDNLETMLLMAMDSGKFKSQKYEKSEFRPDGMKKEVVDLGSLFRLKDRKPSNSYTFDISEDRLYTPDINLLIKNPIDHIDCGMETIILYQQEMKWSRYDIIDRPKGFCSAVKAEAWIACHYRKMDVFGNQNYIKEVFPVNKKGKVIPFKVEGWNLTSGFKKETQEQMVLCCSIVEDAHRPGVMLAKASSESSIIFPIEYGAHKDFFALREGPRETATGRRNPIIHFCEKHIRKTKKSEAEVKKHWRGRDKLTVNGMTLEISTEGL